MKNKFILTEEESKRILSLHKQKIQEERGEIEEDGDPTARWGYGFATLGLSELFKWTSGNAYNKVKASFYRCSIGLETNKPTLSGEQQKSFARTINDSIAGGGTDEDKLAYTFSQIKTYADFCAVSKKYQGMYSESLWDALDGDIDMDSEWLRLWKQIQKYKTTLSPEELDKIAKKCGYSSADEYKKAGGKCPKSGGGTYTGKCAQIVNSYLAQGFVKVTLQRYREYASDKNMQREYKWCAEANDNLYFAKKVSGGGGGGGGGNNGGGGGGGSRRLRYTFNYQDALNALSKKGCPTGGGGQEEDSFADDWRATENKPVDTTVSTDNFSSWAN